jgi:hypothetical protein
MGDDRAAEVRVVREARARGDTWKWAHTALCAQQYFDMSVAVFYSTLPHYLDFISLHTSFQKLGCLSEQVTNVWKAHQITGEDYRQFCQFVPQRQSPILCLSRSQFVEILEDPETLVKVPCLAVSDLDTSPSKDAQEALLHASQRFVLAHLLCHKVNPLPEVWERMRLPRITEAVELKKVNNQTG